MGDTRQPESNFPPDELAPGEPLSGGVAGYRRSVEELGLSALIPTYANSARAVRTFSEFYRKVQAEVEAARRAVSAAEARYHAIETTRTYLLGRLADCENQGRDQQQWEKEYRSLEKDQQFTARQQREAQEHLAHAIKTLEQSRKSLENWRAEKSKARAYLEDDFRTRWCAGEIECSGFPRHDLTARRREWIPRSLIDSLSFDEGSSGPGLAAIVTARDGMSARDPAGRHYEAIRFYLKSELMGALSVAVPLPLADGAAGAPCAADLAEPVIVESPGADAPRDTSALRHRAKKWLAEHVTSGNHEDRSKTVALMRKVHPGLGVRGSLEIFQDYSKSNPKLKLSKAGRKPKRNAKQSER